MAKQRYVVDCVGPQECRDPGSEIRTSIYLPAIDEEVSKSRYFVDWPQESRDSGSEVRLYLPAKIDDDASLRRHLLCSSKLHDALQQAILAGALQDTSANYSRDNPLSGGSTQKWPATGTQPERRGLCSSAGGGGHAWRAMALKLFRETPA